MKKIKVDDLSVLTPSELSQTIDNYIEHLPYLPKATLVKMYEDLLAADQHLKDEHDTLQNIVNVMSNERGFIHQHVNRLINKYEVYELIDKNADTLARGMLAIHANFESKFPGEFIHDYLPNSIT